MKRTTLNIIIILLGATAGLFSAWVCSYHQIPTAADQQRLLENVMRYASTEIAAENYACEGSPVTTVGAVIASLLEMNNTASRNRLRSLCTKGPCRPS